jgi:hypothetical protein
MEVRRMGVFLNIWVFKNFLYSCRLLNVMIVESALAFLGLIIGLLLAHFTKEELKPGRKYFILLERALLFVLVIFLLYRAWHGFIFLIIAFVAGFMVFLGFSVVYLYLGFSLLLAFTYNLTYAYYIVGMIFLLGLVYGALNYDRYRGKKAIIYLLGNFVLFALPFGLYFFRETISRYDFIFFPFAAGALFAKFLLRK